MMRITYSCKAQYMLTARQKIFVDQYMVCRNGAEAARRAGYAERSARITASKLLTKGNIQAALWEKEADLARSTEISKATVVGELRTAIEIAQDNMDAGNMIRGWLTIAKMLGLDTPEAARHVLSAESEAIMAKFAALSDEELMAIAEGRVVIQE